MDIQNIAEPSPLPSPTDTPTKLSDRINISTRSIHAQLNKLILARLPLALPPYTTNSSTYISGLLHVAPIYITFETIWQSILDTPPELLSSEQYDAADKRALFSTGHAEGPRPVHTVSKRVHSLLQNLQLPGLLRAERLRADISILSATPEERIEEQLSAISSKGKLAAFIAQSQRSIKTNPHVLLAYAWVLYMALFSGGRFLRASLQGAGGLGGDFWTRDPSPVRPYAVTSSIRRQEARTEPNMPGPSEKVEEGAKYPRGLSRTRSDIGFVKMFPGMQFFNFDGDKDGEDIKIDFKKRITESEDLLTEFEKDDIIAEAQTIFEFMVELVAELDHVMGTNEEDIESERLHRSFRTKLASRDSLNVAQERNSKKERRNSDTLEPQCLIPDLSQLKNALPSLYYATKSSRRVAFDPAVGEQSGDIRGIRAATLKTAMAALAAGVALLTAWWLIL